jgi:hypothetical protein
MSTFVSRCSGCPQASWTSAVQAVISSPDDHLPIGPSSASQSSVKQLRNRSHSRRSIPLA